MFSTSKPLTDAQLEVHEETRDITEDLLQSIREMKAGKVEIVFTPNIEDSNRPVAIFNHSKTVSQMIEPESSEVIPEEISDWDLHEKVLTRLADKANAVEINLDDL